VTERATPQPVAVHRMRRRLVASIFVAALVPFAAAYLIAGNYVSDQEHRAVETRLAFTLRAADAQYADVLAAARGRARELAARREVAVAMRSGDVEKLKTFLGPREAVVLASGVRVGWKQEPVPVARIEIRSGSKSLGTILAAAPKPEHLLPTIRSRALGSKGDLLAISQKGRVLAGPPGLASVTPDVHRIRLNHHPYIEASLVLPGYSPPVRVVALADEAEAKDSQTQLQRRLALAGLAALLSIVLYSIALSRPLGRWIDQVAEVARQADVDPLTEISNRRGFELALETELLRSARYERPCSLVMTDLDDFKRVNDEHGHDVGDAALIAFSQRLGECVRTSDVVARLGGEEFALLLPELDLEGAVSVAERVRESLEADTLRTRKGRDVRMTASFGVVEAGGSTDAVELTRLADEALYAAKRGGKNRVVVASGPDQPTDEAPREPTTTRST
jgi:diguanylate cyclase (GGDEF)-like protein